MNLERFDDFVKDKCCILTPNQQLRSGYKNRQQLKRAVRIYKDPKAQAVYGGGRSFADIPEQEVENILLASKRFMPIRFVDLDRGTDAPVRPIPRRAVRERQAVDAVQELVASISRQESISQELEEVTAELAEKAERGETPDREQLSYVERLERQLERNEDEIRELKYLVERGKVFERTLAQREMDALEEAEQQEKSSEQQRKLNLFLTTPKSELVQIVEAHKDEIYRLNAEVSSDQRKPYSQILQLGRDRLIKYLFDTLGMDIDELYTTSGLEDIYDEPDPSGAGPSRPAGAPLAPEAEEEEEEEEALPPPTETTRRYNIIEEGIEEGREVQFPYRPGREPEEHTQTRSHDPVAPRP